MRDKKKVIINILFFTLLFIITYWIIFKDKNIDKILFNLGNLKISYIILGLFVMFQYYVLESYNIKQILASFKEKISLMKSIKFSLICAFYSAITPASSGGQPMQIYYMSKEGYSVSHTTIALLAHLFGYQMSGIVLGLIGAFFNHDIFTTELTILFIVGILFNGIALSLTLICIFSTKLSNKLVNIFVKFLKFIRYKKITDTEEKIRKELELYHESADYIKHNGHTFRKAIIISFMQMFVYHSVPYFTYKAFGLSGISYFKIVGLQAILYSTVASIPLPGSIGINETVFLLIYGTIFGEAILADAMLVHRFISFYLFVLINLLVVIYNIIKLSRKEKNNQS